MIRRSDLLPVLLAATLSVCCLGPTVAQAQGGACSPEQLSKAYPQVREQFDVLLGGGQASVTWTLAQEEALDTLRRCSDKIGRRAAFYYAIVRLIRGDLAGASRIVEKLREGTLTGSEKRQIGQLEPLIARAPDPAPAQASGRSGSHGTRGMKKNTSSARITDEGQVYTTINQGECLQNWPSESIKQASGKNAWGRFSPTAGDSGAVVATFRHCSTGVKIYLLDIDGHYVPIRSDGVEVQASSGDPQQGPPARAETPAVAAQVSLEDATIDENGLYVSADGRKQSVDSYGNPLFDAEGMPIWGPLPQEDRWAPLIAAYRNRFPSGDQHRDFTQRRSAMVRDQLSANGITNSAILTAMGAIPMEMFVPAEVASEYIRTRDGSSTRLIDMVYADGPVPIGYDESISQPFMTAYALAVLNIEHGDRVLELKTASGYQTVLLAELGAEVWSVETDYGLYPLVKQVFSNFAYPNLHYKIGDMQSGWSGRTYDAIVATAAYKVVPQSILRLLAPGGVFLVPVGSSGSPQDLRLYSKSSNGYVNYKSLMQVYFSMMPGE